VAHGPYKLLLLLPLSLQVLFIDRHDQLRARLAAGLFEKVWLR
jgi:hypothetical protein